MKTMKAICKKCGVVEISGIFQDQGEEGFIVPLGLCPTIQQLGKLYKDYDGSAYKYFGGGKISDDFKIETLELLHTNHDDDGEDWQEHILEPIECWRQQI